MTNVKDVACAIITSPEGKTLVVQRSAKMLLPLKWEFPGGKVEPGETPAACLAREIGEELQVRIRITGELRPREYAYETVTIRLIPFLAEITAGEIFLHEHADLGWFTHAELLLLDWAAADVAVVREYTGR
ncbi:(deoxy)nucleoside triphosphate pyrophosphohydrolase [Hufsiella ginkgonis]|uniref:8-oxo-dGTP diphosphatase n=1 Tax=Hufsiella ginkgonis TaxID=2695274 RepID=A0A7K1XVK5_9SPHI|nr:(deoxy)nucleoside triphosphate pyrophosphohydrolase [Hufsiella ginkgonis]MXV14838.1 NUDIX domain-containing protein [Hufsiella ginkgonis]